jgi:probable rRNA maturation factor
MNEDGPRPSNEQPIATPALDTEIVRHDDAWTAHGISDAMIDLAAHAAVAVALPARPAHCELSVLLTGDMEIRDLNKTWRGKDQPTNVLSFPAEDNPRDTGFVSSRYVHGVPVLLGDIVLALETAMAEASEKEITLSDHVSHLVVHGVLHLLGFDHLEQTEADRMESLEQQALASLGISDPYADAISSEKAFLGVAEIAK